MTEKTKKPRKRATKTKAGTRAFEIANQTLLEMFNSSISLLTQMLNTGKVNPLQGLLATICVADLLHGGAIVCSNTERPYLAGPGAKYAGTTGVGATDFYPIPGINILDIVGSLLGIEGAAAENLVGQAITAEVYLNANCPHRFPKLLSDEAYAKILVMADFMSHAQMMQTEALGIKTFVEASAIPVKALGEAAKNVGQGVGAASKSIEALLSLAPETGEYDGIGH